MNLLFTICARAGSKGIKNKNTKDFLGYPLPYYTISAIDLYMKQYGCHYENITVAVNSDSEALIEIVKKSGLKFTPIKRKSILASDTAAKIDVIKDTLVECEIISNLTYDIVIDLDLTSPLRQVEDISLAIKTITENPTVELVFSVTESRRNPYFNMVIEDNGSFRKVLNSDYTTRQQAPQIYDMNASIYVYQSEFLKNERNTGIFNAKILVVKMLDTAVLDIDSNDDFELMEVLAGFFYEKYPLYKNIYNHIKMDFPI